MNEPIPDDELNNLFARQRAADRENVSSFHAMRTHSLEAQQSREPDALGQWWRWGSKIAAAAVLALVVLLVTPRPSPLSRPQPDRLAQQLDVIDAVLQKSLAAQHDLSAWQSPTDFLLPPIQHLDQR